MNKHPSWRWGAYSPEMPWTDSSVDTFSNLVGSKPQIVHIYRPVSRNEELIWPDLAKRIEKYNFQPLITWEPFSASLLSIASGDYDDVIRNAGKSVASINRTSLFRFAHEMNGDWYSWGKQPTLYRQAYRRVVKLFRQVGATNAKFVWCPNILGYGIDNPNLYYPGDDYVHWLGIDGYNWNEPWKSFVEVLRPTYMKMQNLAVGKPMIIAEIATVESSLKPQWIRQAAKVLSDGQIFPRVKAAMWFNGDFAGQNSWRIDSSQESLKAFKESWS